MTTPSAARPARIGVLGAGRLDTVARIVDALGFDPVTAGRLADGVRLEPGTAPFGANVGPGELRAMIARFPGSHRGRAAIAARK
jgi:predicted dinucleotide-binding enzyme